MTTRLADRLGRWEMHMGGDVCFSTPPHMLCMYFSTFTKKKLLTNVSYSF
jgi:hypothetical protein